MEYIFETRNLKIRRFEIQDAQKLYENHLEEEVKKYFPKKVFRTVIPRSVRLSEAPSFGMPIQYYDKSSKGSVQQVRILAEPAVSSPFCPHNGLSPFR